MKKNFFSAFFTCFAMLAFIGISDAQDDKMRDQPKSVDANTLPALKADLQEFADHSQQTIMYPFESTISGVQVNATLIVQPNTDASATIEEPKYEEGSKSRGIPLKPAPFKVEILQSVCTRSGVTLEVIVPGIASDAHYRDFVFVWGVDGSKVSSSRRIECVNGRVAILDGRKISTRERVTVKIQLPGMNDKMHQASNARSRGGSDAGLVASYKKTGCLGDCPAYEVQVFSDNTVTWNGKKNVDRLGTYKATLTPEQMKILLDTAEKTDFFNKSPQYPDYPVDASLPKTEIFFQKDKKENQVTDVFDAPADLIALEGHVEDLLKALKWEKTK